MAAFLPEPGFDHRAPAAIGVLLVNLGTPDEASAPAVRRYLAQFLSDPRVVEIPRAVWLPVLYGIILTVRPKRSAAKYAAIWTPEGSPLMVHTRRQAELLAARFAGESAGRVVVDMAMRYGKPSVGDRLTALKAAGCDRILVVPMYPQYAASTTGSVFDAVAEHLQRTRNLPELRVARNFHDDPAYIQALANSVREHFRDHGRPDRLVMSFHGLPRYTLDRGDPYFCECQKTGRLLGEELGLAPGEGLVTFQSRFGRAQWLEPYTAPTLERLGREGVRRVAVVCPGFVADCLETLEEIAMEGRESFVSAGGSQLDYIPCLNEREDWLDALEAICRSQLQGWQEPALAGDALDARQARARSLGAPR